MSTETNNTAIRVWTNPSTEEEDQPSLVCLKEDRLTLATVVVADLEKTAADLKNGGDVVGKSIPLEAIILLQGDEGDCDLIIAFKQGESKSDKVTVTLLDSGQRDELLDTLTTRLGPGWVQERRQVHRLWASLWPAGVGIVVALLTWFMYTEAVAIAAGQQVAEGRRGRSKLVMAILHWVEGSIGPTGVLIVGGLLLALCLCWLISVLSRPPVQITVRPREE